jgi:LPXTG-site transpeptidase (sortase) family protein
MSVAESTTGQVDTGPDPAPRVGWRGIVRWFGMLCLMGAAGAGGYLGWLLWGTGLETKRAQEALRADFVGIVDTRLPAEGDDVVRLPGQAYAQIQIPSIGVDFIVVEGTDYETLKKGAGHYPSTADPWDQTGRVGIAGHRTTYLHPFSDLDKVEVGDDIVLRTEFGTFTYQVTRNFIIPSAGSGRVLSETRQPSLVLTTCHPRFSSAERLIVTATRVDGPTA